MSSPRNHARPIAENTDIWVGANPEMESSSQPNIWWNYDSGSPLPPDASVNLCIGAGESEETRRFLRELPSHFNAVTIYDCSYHAVSNLSPHIIVANITMRARPEAIASLPQKITVIDHCLLLTPEIARAIPLHIERINQIECESEAVFDALPEHIKQSLAQMNLTTADVVKPKIAERQLVVESQYFFLVHGVMLRDVHDAFMVEGNFNQVSQYFTANFSRISRHVNNMAEYLSVINKFFDRMWGVKGFFVEPYKIGDPVNLARIYIRAFATEIANKQSPFAALNNHRACVSGGGMYALSVYSLLRDAHDHIRDSYQSIGLAK